MFRWVIYGDSAGVGHVCQRRQSVASAIVQSVPDVKEANANDNSPHTGDRCGR